MQASLATSSALFPKAPRDENAALTCSYSATIKKNVPLPGDGAVINSILMSMPSPLIFFNPSALCLSEIEEGRFETADIPYILSSLPLSSILIPFKPAADGMRSACTTPPPVGYHPHLSIETL